MCPGRTFSGSKGPTVGNCSHETLRAKDSASNPFVHVSGASGCRIARVVRAPASSRETREKRHPVTGLARGLEIPPARDPR